MNVRRVLILSITLLAAGAAGYGLLGLRAPKQAPTAAPGVAATRQTIIAVGPDGTLYAVQVPSQSDANRAYNGGGYRRYEPGEGGGYGSGYEHE